MKTTTDKRIARTILDACVASALLALPTQAHADETSDRISELERKLEQSMKVIDSLSAKVKQLEANAAKSATEPAKQEDAIAERVTGLEQQVSAISNRSTADDGLPLHGFTDVGYQFNNQHRARGANLGNLDLYLAPSFGDRVKSLIELTFEINDRGDLDVDLERLQIGYTFSDQLTLWSGRFHTPYGYWNTAFHHGAQLQTSILRPRFLDFEDRGGILPAHGVGLWATGSVKTGGSRLSYDAYVVNAPRIGFDSPGTPSTGELNPNLAGSTNHNAMIGGRVAYTFGGSLDGLTLGLHGLGARVQDDANVIGRTDLRMIGGYGAYLANDWEVLGEYYHFDNRNLTGELGTHHSWAGYLQAGRTFGRWTPYGRYEKTSLSQSDNYFAAQASGQSYARGVIGLRYDVNPKTALKLELNHTKLTDRETDRFNEARVQYAIRF